MWGIYGGHSQGHPQGKASHSQCSQHGHTGTGTASHQGHTGTSLCPTVRGGLGPIQPYTEPILGPVCRPHWVPTGISVSPAMESGQHDPQWGPTGTSKQTVLGLASALLLGPYWDQYVGHIGTTMYLTGEPYWDHNVPYTGPYWDHCVPHRRAILGPV